MGPTEPDALSDGSATGAGATRPPSNGRSERFALAAAGVPFRLKLAVVWAAIFVVLGTF